MGKEESAHENYFLIFHSALKSHNLELRLKHRLCQPFVKTTQVLMTLRNLRKFR